MSAALLDFVADDQASTPRSTLSSFDELAREPHVIQQERHLAITEALARWSDPLFQG